MLRPIIFPFTNKRSHSVIITIVPFACATVIYVQMILMRIAVVRLSAAPVGKSHFWTVKPCPLPLRKLVPASESRVIVLGYLCNKFLFGFGIYIRKMSPKLFAYLSCFIPEHLIFNKSIGVAVKFIFGIAVFIKLIPVCCRADICIFYLIAHYLSMNRQPHIGNHCECHCCGHKSCYNSVYPFFALYILHIYPPINNYSTHWRHHITTYCNTFW